MKGIRFKVKPFFLLTTNKKLRGWPLSGYSLPFRKIIEIFIQRIRKDERPESYDEVGFFSALLPVCKMQMI